MLVCELSLNGLISEPVSWPHVQSAKLIGHYASITGGWGDFADRNWGPYALLAAKPVDVGPPYTMGAYYWPPNLYWMPYPDESILSRVDGVPLAERLAQQSISLPSFVAAAYYNAIRSNLAEASVDAWVAVEQILSDLWRQHVAAIPDGARRRRLTDSRTYPASVMAEVLFTAGTLPERLYGEIQRARKHRNDLAHGGAVSEEGARACLTAMVSTLNHVCSRSVYSPNTNFMGGGMGPPGTELEPEIPLD
jgi:hypothetical protein